MIRLAQDDLALTFDDVLLLPADSNVLPKDVNLKTYLNPNISLNIPLLSAAMDTVTEAPMAIALAQEGGLGIIHKNMSIEAQAAQVLKVKKFESGIVKNPITINPQTTVREVLNLRKKYHFNAFPVVDNNSQVVGILTNRDIRFEANLEQPVSNLMTNKNRLVTVNEAVERKMVESLLHQHRIEKVLVVNDNFQLIGMITARDILTEQTKPFACKDAMGRLRVGAAVGTSAETEDRIEALIAAGVDIIVVDTAHGHSKNVLDRVRWVKKHFKDTVVMAGNIGTSEAAEALVKAGANILKVGLGAGSICTTRIVSGVGVPQLTAIANVCKVVAGQEIGVIADGGIHYSGDICKAIAAGADAVMIGSLFAGTEEATGEIELYQGRSYKSYRGMGSLGAMAQRHSSKDRYFQEGTSDTEKLVPEGIEGRVPYKGGMINVTNQLMGGLRSGMGYVGCKDIHALQTKSQFVRVTVASVHEGHVHDVQITKEAPNYQIRK